MTINQLVKLCESLSRDRKKSYNEAKRFGVRIGDVDVLRKILGLTDKEKKMHKLSDDDREWILCHIKDNPTTQFKFYAQKFNVTNSAIFYFLKSNGITSEISANRKWSVFKRKRLEVFVKKGLTDKAIAERMGLSVTCIEQARKRILGIKKRGGRGNPQGTASPSPSCL